MENSEKTKLVNSLAEALLKVGALKIGSFQTSGGKTTPYFIDLKKIASFPEVFDLALSCLRFALKNDLKGGYVEFDYVCGVPTSGLLLATVLAHELRIPLIYPAASSREAVSRILRGILRPGSKVLVIDDVSETGLSLKTSAQSVQASGGIVRYALTIIDRQEGAEQVLEKLDIKLKHFTTMSEIAQILKDRMAMSDEQ